MSGVDGQQGPVRRAFWLGAAALVGAAMLAACGSSSSSTTTSTAASGSSGSGGSSSKLDSLSSSVQAAQKSTFMAVYSSTSGGSTSTVTLAQSPPKQMFSSTDSSGTTTSLINTGSATYSCSDSGGGTATCTSIGGGLANSALSGLISVYNGSAALTVMKGWQSSLAAHLAGASLTFSDETIAGQSATCADWSHGSDKATYCVTSSGVLAKVQTSSGSSGGESFVLTSYTNSPPASQFETPAGATVVTLPGGASAP